MNYMVGFSILQDLLEGGVDVSAVGMFVADFCEFSLVAEVALPDDLELAQINTVYHILLKG